MSTLGHSILCLKYVHRRYNSLIGFRSKKFGSRNIWGRKYLVSGTLYEGPAPECTSEYVTGPGRFMARKVSFEYQGNIFKHTINTYPNEMCKTICRTP